jgi:predicted acetyltransferase
MSLELATFTDLLPIFRENYSLWSTGLSRQLYEYYLWRQTVHPWGRKHIRYAVLRHKSAIVSSCKIYSQVISYRHEQLPLFGIGAVFTPEKYRGFGFAGRLLAQVIAAAKSEDMTGVYLFSDIGEEFYERFDFVPFSDIDFFIDLSFLQANKASQSLRDQDPRVTVHLLSQQSGYPCALTPGISNELLEEITCHYQRWLTRQPFAVYRNEDYFSFKLGKEDFLRRHSTLKWPAKTIWLFRSRPGALAYAITEQAPDSFRILEIVGTADGREAIWQAIFRYSLRHEIKRIKGWEAVVNDFSPSYSWHELCPDALRAGLGSARYRINSQERGWGLPMLVPISRRLHNWWSYLPCPFLELDHF